MRREFSTTTFDSRKVAGKGEGRGNRGKGDEGRRTEAKAPYADAINEPPKM